MDEIYEDDMMEMEQVYPPKEQEVKNTKELVESLIRENKIDEASKAGQNSYGRDRYEIIDLLKEIKPTAPVCIQCGGELRQIFKEDTMKWGTDNYCADCDYKIEKDDIKENAERIMKARGVGGIFLGARLSDFKADIHKVVENGSFITGPRGIGKTHLLAAIMRQEIIKTEPIKINDFRDLPRYSGPYLDDFPLITSVPELLLEIRSTFGTNKDVSELEIIKKYSEHPILFLDDLGAEKDTSWSVSTLYLLINRRYEEDLKTYITSNLNLDQIADRLDDRIASRIAGMCEILKIEGPDRRLK